MLPVLLAAVGVAIDLGRLYAVKGRAQSALDAAVLGAVSTAATTNVTFEARAIFSANYPNGYMGTTNTTPMVLTQGSSAYLGYVRVTVPWAVMRLFGVQPLGLEITSKVTIVQGGSDMELVMVVDNSNNFNVNQLRNPLQDFVLQLFGGQAIGAGKYITVLPFDVAVNVGNTPITHQTWPQNLATFLALGGVGSNGYLANRNPDIPPDASYADVTDAPPTVVMTTRFRTPYGMQPGTYPNGDFVLNSRPLQRVTFASNNLNTLLSGINGMRRSGQTRINVGLMWGWFALSPRWQGQWNPALPGLPQAFANGRQKVMVLVVGSRNNVYLGGTQTCGPGTCAVSNDNTTTAQLCAAIKGAGIELFAVGYGSASNYDETQLRACATDAGHFIAAANATELRTALRGVSDRLKFSTLRLSQ